jgi:hypothetical protein
MRLRDVEPGDVDAYIAMRCDPVMTAELGGPLPREGIGEKVKRGGGALRERQLVVASAAASRVTWPST